MTVRLDVKREYLKQITEGERWRKLAEILFDIINQERARHGVGPITKAQFITYLKSK